MFEKSRAKWRTAVKLDKINLTTDDAPFNVNADALVMPTQKQNLVIKHATY